MATKKVIPITCISLTVPLCHANKNINVCNSFLHYLLFTMFLLFPFFRCCVGFSLALFYSYVCTYIRSRNEAIWCATNSIDSARCSRGWCSGSIATQDLFRIGARVSIFTVFGCGKWWCIGSRRRYECPYYHLIAVFLRNFFLFFGLLLTALSYIASIR